jgi:hypothetical protein
VHCNDSVGSFQIITKGIATPKSSGTSKDFNSCPIAHLEIALLQEILHLRDLHRDNCCLTNGEVKMADFTYPTRFVLRDENGMVQTRSAILERLGKSSVISSQPIPPVLLERAWFTLSSRFRSFLSQSYSSFCVHMTVRSLSWRTFGCAHRMQSRGVSLCKDFLSQTKGSFGHSYFVH